MKRSKTWAWVLLILLLPVIGYAIMHGSVYMLPLSGYSVTSALIFAAVIIAIGFLVPLGIVKFGIHVASANNPRNEPELELKNVALDKAQLAHTQQREGKIKQAANVQSK